MDTTERYFPNQFVLSGKSLTKTETELVREHTKTIKDFFNKHCEEFNKKYINYEADAKNSSGSVYAGIAGIAMMFMKLSRTNEKYLTTALTLLLQAKGSKNKIGFLCGNIGCLALLAHCYHLKGDHRESKVFIEKVVHELKYLDDPYHTDELLNGRVGYLFAMLYLKVHNIYEVEEDCIKMIVRSVINSGLRKKNSDRLPLNYEWHGKQYLGAAHGYAGILFMLLQAKEIFPNSIEAKDMRLIEDCLEKLLRYQFPSKNMMSSIGSGSDRLVHWCHGAPGVIYLYILASKVFRNSTYMKIARDFGDVIWSRGLLRRGYGLCHGVSGNGYAFLALYQATGELEYLKKALKFADWCVTREERTCRIPDAPDSLYKGFAGVLNYLHDILNPGDAYFPAFQLFPFERIVK